jgi:hypothetical protein
MKINDPFLFLKEFGIKYGYLYYKAYYSTEYFLHGKYHINDMIIIDEKLFVDISFLEEFIRDLLETDTDNRLYNELCGYIESKKILYSIELLENI